MEIISFYLTSSGANECILYPRTSSCGLALSHGLSGHLCAAVCGSAHLIHGCTVLIVYGLTSLTVTVPEGLTQKQMYFGFSGSSKTHSYTYLTSKSVKYTLTVYPEEKLR